MSDVSNISERKASMQKRLLICCVVILAVCSRADAGDCVKNQYGDVVCGKGQCATDQYGKVLCAKEGGGAMRANMGTLSAAWGIARSMMWAR